MNVPLPRRRICQFFMPVMALRTGDPREGSDRTAEFLREDDVSEEELVDIDTLFDLAWPNGS